jgi:hypothetical protein
MDRIAAIAAIKACQARGGKEKIDWAGYMFQKQRDFVFGEDRMKVGLTSRRAGKSTSLAGGLLSSIDGKPGRVALYLTLTRMNAKRILWPTARALLHQLGVPYTVNLTDLEIRLNGGGTLLIGGVDTQEQVERWRGYAYQSAAVDECQSFPSHRLRSLIQDVLRPALADYRGPLFLTGTPGPVPAGYWYDLSGPHARQRVHTWTGLDNPHIPHFAEELAAIREENGWTETHPTYLREYMGQWTVDTESLVYPWNALRNEEHRLPTRTQSNAVVDPHQWRFVTSVDVGQIHATAFVVVGAHPSLPEDYVVRAEVMRDMTTDRMADRIRELRLQYPGPVVMDTQGIGRRHADEVMSRFGIPIEAADKQDKSSGIRIVRDRLLTGHIKTLPGALPLVGEWETIVWNRERNDHERDQEDHCADACIYAVKRLRNYTDTHLRPQPKVGSREWSEQQEREMWERRRRSIRKQQKANRWDR